MLDRSCQVQRAPQSVRGDDLYETPAVAVEALLRVEQLPHWLWEPAAGRGAIVNVLRAAGFRVLASDLVDYGEPTHFARRDFLMERLPDKVEAIVTNPPYKLAEQLFRSRARSLPTGDHVAAARVPRKRPAQRYPRGPRPGSRARLPQAAADDASRRMERAAGWKQHPIRMVRMESRTHRPNRAAPNLVGGGPCAIRETMCAIVPTLSLLPLHARKA